MKAIGVNGSPRKKWNTATLLEKALKGAGSQGAKTELFHLYDLNYKGCISCFACKKKPGKSYGKCAVKDGLMPVLEKVNEADVIISMGSNGFGETSASEPLMRCRKQKDDVETGGVHYSRISPGETCLLPGRRPA